MKLKYCPYGKCYTTFDSMVDFNGNEFELYTLRSYQTVVCTLEHNVTYDHWKMTYKGGFSVTTQKHIRAFVREMNEQFMLSFAPFSEVSRICGRYGVTIPVTATFPSIGDYTLFDYKNSKWLAVKAGKVVFIS